MRALLKTPAYRDLINHECFLKQQQKQEDIVSAVYDSPAWKEFMGPITFPNNRIGLQICMDGIPAFSFAKNLSLKPVEATNMSLPPAVRNKIDNILLLMLVPDSLKQGQKKYFDFAARYELNDLFHDGVEGVKVKMFSSSMDTPGRAEMLGMQNCQAYQSCCVCTHTWSPGPRRKCMYDGYRCFLRMGSRGRDKRVVFRGHVYEYRDVEERPIPTRRDDGLVHAAVKMAMDRRQPILGHKRYPLLSQWPGFSWYRFNPPDLMHDSKLVLEMLLKLMVGYVYDAGSYSAWGTKDKNHRADFRKYGFQKDLWEEDTPLPWRLTKQQRLFLDQRMLNTVWPHYLDRVAYRGNSFWTKPNRLWKTRRKILLLYYILPTQIRDQVPKLREAVFSFVWAMRRLEGQVHSCQHARSLGILPGSRTVRRSDLKRIHNDLVRSLCLFEGCIPTDYLNPALHHFVHYGQYTMSHGPLYQYWMMIFERCVKLLPFVFLLCQHHVPHVCRFNKHIKNLCRHNDSPEENLSNTVRHDVSARFVTLLESEAHYDVTKDVHHRCILSGRRGSRFELTPNNLADLRMMSPCADRFSIMPFLICHVMGIHFRAGEWGKQSCGSVITTVVDGQSLYAAVLGFVKVSGDPSSGYAVVNWFSKPEYPFKVPLVVKVTEDGSDLEDVLGTVIRIDTIDPSRIMIGTDTVEGVFYMMRDSGYDTIRSV